MYYAMFDGNCKLCSVHEVNFVRITHPNSVDGVQGVAYYQFDRREYLTPVIRNLKSGGCVEIRNLQ